MIGTKFRLGLNDIYGDVRWEVVSSAGPGKWRAKVIGEQNEDDEEEEPYLDKVRVFSTSQIAEARLLPHGVVGAGHFYPTESPSRLAHLQRYFASEGDPLLAGAGRRSSTENDDRTRQRAQRALGVARDLEREAHKFSDMLSRALRAFAMGSVVTVDVLDAFKVLKRPDMYGSSYTRARFERDLSELFDLRPAPVDQDGFVVVWAPSTMPKGTVRIYSTRHHEYFRVGYLTLRSGMAGQKRPEPRQEPRQEPVKAPKPVRPRKERAEAPEEPGRSARSRGRSDIITADELVRRALEKYK
jgi:hypothetical protein